MYGMIHKAARAYAIQHLGEPFWLSFSEQQGFAETDFILSQTYSDEMTLAMIGGLAEAAATPPAEFLRGFGRYWIEFARSGVFAHLMPMGGDTLPTFIGNLNRMHTGLAVTMPGSRMPSFYILGDTPEALRISYVSERDGLEPFVLGLLEGLCTMFDVQADVVHTPDEGAVVFEVRYRLSAAA